MPIATDPDTRVPFSLAHDANKPEATRPTFLCRAMSRREKRRALDLVQQAYDEKDDAVSYAYLLDSLRIGLVGWKNMADRDGKPIPFDLNEIDTLLTEGELWELAWSAPHASGLTGNDLPNSEGQLPATGAAPANHANQSA